MSRIPIATRTEPGRLGEYLTMYRAPDSAVALALLRMDIRTSGSGFGCTGSDLVVDRAAMHGLSEMSGWMRRASACRIPMPGDMDALVQTMFPQVYPATVRSAR